MKKSSSRLPILWITDPWDTLDHARDTSLRLLGACEEEGVLSAWGDVSTLRLENGEPLIDALAGKEILRILKLPKKNHSALLKTKLKAASLSQFCQIHYRTDPPIDLHYLHPLQILALATRKYPKIEVVNPIPILFLHNEKTEAHFLPKRFIPRTVVAAQPSHLARFLKEEKTAVLKPLHEAQSKGIQLLKWNSPLPSRRTQALNSRRSPSPADSRLQSLWEARFSELTHNQQFPLLLQEYLPDIENGEVRLWFVDGSLLAYVRKLPIKGDFRVNMDQGSQVVPTQLDAASAQTAKALSRHLKSLGVRLAAIDVIGGKVTDFNFTSPGLIVTMEEVLKRPLANQIVRALAK